MILPDYRNVVGEFLLSIIRTFDCNRRFEYNYGDGAKPVILKSEFIIMLNQASTDRLKLAELLNISDLQMYYITNVEAGHVLIKVSSSLVPFVNKFPKNTKFYKLMTTKPGVSA